jgi:hypothetical protein
MFLASLNPISVLQPKLTVVINKTYNTMLIFILNLPAPVFTLLLVLYLVLVVYVLITIAKSDQTFGTKILLLAIMILVPLSPILYLIFRSPAKSAKNT